MIQSKNSGNRIARAARGLMMLCGISAAALGCGAVAARADRLDDLRAAVRHDVDIVHRDEVRISRLESRHDMQVANNDRRLARRTQEDIDRAQLDLQRDQDKLRVDRRLLDRYSDNGHMRREYYRLDRDMDRDWDRGRQ